MDKRWNHRLIIGMLLVFSGCTGQQSQADFDYGHIEDNIYTNAFFNLSMTLPANWVLQSEKEAENIMEEGRKLVAGDDKNLESVLKVSEVNTANLFMIYQYELGTAVDYNPSMVLIAENLRNAPGVKTGADYLFHARKFLTRAEVQYDNIDEKFEEVHINGVPFHLMNTRIKYLGYDIKQKYYSTVLNGFSLNMIISYADDEQMGELEESVNSMVFKL